MSPFPQHDTCRTLAGDADASPDWSSTTPGCTTATVEGVVVGDCWYDLEIIQTLPPVSYNHIISITVTTPGEYVAYRDKPLWDHLGVWWGAESAAIRRGFNH